VTRRQKGFIAIGILTAGLVIFGLGARKDESAGWKEPSPEMCRNDLAGVLEWCRDETWCKGLCDEDIDACQAGCVMAVCSEQVTCEDVDPKWCTGACADWHTARYWTAAWRAHAQCERPEDEAQDDEEWQRTGFDAWANCTKARMKEQCPEFTRWEVRQRWMCEYDKAHANDVAGELPKH